MMHSYGKVYNLGHRAVRDIFNGPVIIEEKVDGSQFSFGVECDGTLVMRSKGKDQTHAPDKLFQRAAATVTALKSRLVPSWTYRGEVLDTPRHNTLKYDRVPTGNIVLFDIDMGEEDYVSPETRDRIADALGLESVPCFITDHNVTLEQLVQYLDTESFLGGPKIEGVVVKSLNMYDESKKRLMAKHVSEAFKEKHQHDWKHNNPSAKDIVNQLAGRYGTEARWRKSVQHARENGTLLDAPQDIGPLIKAIQADIMEEEADEIRELLFKYAWDRIARGVVSGFAEWYKQQLLEKQFEEASNALHQLMPNGDVY